MKKNIVIKYHSESAPTYVNPDIKIGRNMHCPCGSGKKFKHCCLEKKNAPLRELLIKAGKQNVGTEKNFEAQNGLRRAVTKIFPALRRTRG